MVENEESVYDEILGENQDESSETKENTDESSEEQSEVDKKAEPQKERKITAEDAKRLGLGKGFIGKPYHKTVDDVVIHLSKWNNSLNQKITDIEKKLNVNLSSQQKKDVEETVEDKLPEMPDPFQDPKGFAKWLDKRDELTRKAIAKEIDDKLKTVDSREKIGELEADRNSVILSDLLEDSLQIIHGEKYSSETLQTLIDDFDEYLDAMKEEDFKDFESIYKGKPKQLAVQMIRFHKEQLFDKSHKSEEPEKPKKESHEEKVNKLKNKTKKFTQSASSSREKFEGDEENNDYKELAKEAELRVNEETE